MNPPLRCLALVLLSSLLWMLPATAQETGLLPGQSPPVVSPSQGPAGNPADQAGEPAATPAAELNATADGADASAGPSADVEAGADRPAPLDTGGAATVAGAVDAAPGLPHAPAVAEHGGEGAAAGHEQEDGGDHGGGGWMDEIYRLINFLILGALVYAIIGRKIPALLRKRHDDIKATIVGAEDRQQRLELKLADSAALQARTALQVQETLARAEQAAQRRSEEILRTARADAEQLKHAAARRKQLAEENLVADLAQFLLSRSLSFAEGELRGKLSDADRSNMADAFIHNIGQVQL